MRNLMKNFMAYTLVCLYGIGPAAYCQERLHEDRFESAAIQASPKSLSVNQGMRAGTFKGGRYIIRQATLLDLIQLAYGVEPDKVLGGPSWLEMRRFDVVARAPSGSQASDLPPMLRSLLADRFRLSARREDRMTEGYSLVSSGTARLSRGDESQQGDCHSVPVRSADRSGEVRYSCRNVDMDGFATRLRSMALPVLGRHPVVNETGIRGRWSFELSYALPGGSNSEDELRQFSIFRALERQLGLRLESKNVSVSALVVESATDTADPAPTGPAPNLFEVASVKRSGPTSRLAIQFLPGGRFVTRKASMRDLLFRAFNSRTKEQFAGMPGWVDEEHYDIEAVLSDGAEPPGLDLLSPMVHALLVERFNMRYHEEQRDLTAWSLVTSKTGARPKLKPSDPAARSSCNTTPPPPGKAGPSSVLLTCRNMTVAQFADHIQHLSPEITLPVADETGLAGVWDFSLTYSAIALRSPEPGPEGTPSASDPSGDQSLFEALEKQLGLKLVKRGRALPVYVIEHLDRDPSGN